MKKITQVVSILLVIILALLFSLPALAQNNTTVTITMDTESVIAISLSRTNWALGAVSSNTEKITSPYATWCTITNEGNASVNIYIKGEDAQWVGRPVNTYIWTLSNDETNGEHRYALWYHIAYDTAGSYTLITKESVPMRHVKKGSSLDGMPLNLSVYNDTARFGLKLLTPTYFYAGKEMATRITISAVAA